MSKKPHKPRTKITPEMSLAEKFAAIRRRSRGGFFPHQHPDARAPRDNQKGLYTWKGRAKLASKDIPNLDSWNRKKFTTVEIKQMYFALYELMAYYGGNKKLASEDTGVAIKTINAWIDKGRVTPFGADILHNNDRVPFTREQLRPDITKKGWQNFDKIKHRFYDRRDRQLQSKVKGKMIL